MPVKSRKQARFMGMVAAGKKKVEGLTPEQAREFLKGVKFSKLPLRKKGK